MVPVESFSSPILAYAIGNPVLFTTWPSIVICPYDNRQKHGKKRIKIYFFIVIECVINIKLSQSAWLVLSFSIIDF
jgi:hypothetical protein